MELVYTTVLEAVSERIESSSLSGGTKLPGLHFYVIKCAIAVSENSTVRRIYRKAPFKSDLRNH